jgi:tetratricopeptide (TPR) repeat protein
MGRGHFRPIWPAVLLPARSTLSLRHAINHILDAFEKAWSGEVSPDLGQFYAEQFNNERGEATADGRELLCELAMIDLWHRWQRAPGSNLPKSDHSDVVLADNNGIPARPLLEDYIHRFPAMGAIGQLPARLISEEFRARRSAGVPVARDEYQRRFAGRPDVLDAIEQIAMEDCASLSIAEISTDRVNRPLSTQTPGTIQIRCPSCHTPMDVAADTRFTDLTCTACGSDFSLVDRSQATQVAPPLSSMGRFELIERLGVGGFGSVWKARDKELDRTVAIKIPRQGGMTADDQEKFFREARAAAQLRHPNIVSVHEVGRDKDSVYIVSDFVRGVTLSDWLSGQQITRREAAELCAKIADALHHAHEQGVVHRDLKPANIMMDGDGQPHIMDFGLARREVGEVTVTMDGQILGTPAYMSPEQAQGQAHTADRCSDVYSLGVILFQFLTGELPFRGNVRMLMHQVIHDEPPSPRKLNANISKDLETITLKCLEKDPSRRYPTAKDLADELRRFISGKPIRARPIGSLGCAWRWAKRRPAAAALLVLLAVVAVGSAAAFIRERALRREVATQKTEAEAERESAEAVVSFLTQDVLGKASPQEMQDKAVRDILVKTLIEPAAANVRQGFSDKPLVEASVQHTLAETLSALGRSDLALVHAERALEQRRKLLGENHPNTIRSLNSYAVLLQSLGRGQEAEPLYKQALEQFRKVLGDDDPETITALNNYAGALKFLGRAKEAEPLYKQALEQFRKALGEDDSHTIACLNNYAGVLEELGRAQEAEPLRRQALQQYRKVFGVDHPDTITALNNYAFVLKSLGRTEEAAPLYEQALEQCRKVLGEDHPDTITSLNNYASMLEMLGRIQEAAPLYELALKQSSKVSGEDHRDTIVALNNYAGVLEKLGRAQESEPLYMKALETSRKVLGANHPYTIKALSNYSFILNSLDRVDEAAVYFEQALENSRNVLGEDHPITIDLKYNLTMVYLNAGRPTDAVKANKQLLAHGLYATCLEIATRLGPDAVADVVEIAATHRGEQTPQSIDAFVLGELRLISGNLDSAETAIRAAIQRGPATRRYSTSLGWCLLAQGKADDARGTFQEVLKDCRRDDGSYDLKNADPDQMTAAYFLGVVQEPLYIDANAADKQLACVPWFYVGQRHEIEGHREAAIAAYVRCVELGSSEQPQSLSALARWRLDKLSATGKPERD